MRTVNKVILIGNITRDPLIKTTEGGKKMAMFTVATNRYYKTADGTNKSEAEFHNCVAWGTLAERAEQFLTKGKLVYIEGRMKTRVIDKDDGEKLYKTETVASNMIFLNKRGEFDDNTSSETTESTDALDSIDDDDMF
jgi:single-strand DNA-binding protein